MRQQYIDYMLTTSDFTIEQLQEMSTEMLRDMVATNIAMNWPGR